MYPSFLPLCLPSLKHALPPPLHPGENPYKVDVEQITQRAKLLQRYLSDEKKELQALYALQALMVHMEQPASEYSTAVSLTSVL